MVSNEPDRAESVQALTDMEIPHRDLSKQKWRMRIVVSATVDFAVQVLVDDGLVVGPFDHHQVYPGALQRDGLNADLWAEWVDRIVLDTLGAEGGEVDPVASWPGQRKLNASLTESWDRYRSSYEPSDARLQGPATAPEAFGHEVIKAERFYGLPLLSVFLVRYAAPVLYMANPNVALIGDNRGDLGGAELARLITHAAENQLGMNV